MRKLFNLSSLKLPLAVLTASLMLAGCLDDDDKKGTTTQQPNPNWEAGAEFHGAEWATIKNLDPRGEECVDCHGKEANLSPNGGKGHNIGLANNTDHSDYKDVKITSVKVHDDPTDTANFGKVTVKLNQALPAGNVTMTFAKLAPRVIHNRGHDWQNYFVNNNLGRGGREPTSKGFDNGGAAPFAITPTRVSATEYTFNLGDGAGREFGKHNFTQGTAYAADKDEAGYKWEYEGVLGTKFSTPGWDISNHVYCDAAFEEANVNFGNRANPDNKLFKYPANQLAATKGTNEDKRPVCWWPDGTHLTSGVFVSTDNEYIVEYDADLTHRVTFIVGMGAGNPGFNTWFDFVPSIANGKKLEDLKSELTSLIEVEGKKAKIDIDLSYINADGSINANAYEVAQGNAAANVANDSESAAAAVTSTLHQAMPAAREVVDMQSCNSCHDGFAMHGGSGRSQTQVCVTCHNPGNLQASSGRSVDFKQLVHRIHRGADLPSEQLATNVTSKQLENSNGDLLFLDKDGNDTTAAVDGDGKAHTPKTNPVKAIGSLMGENTLVANTASDFTKVRFPQGPTPGQAAGITNCVKCHMGSETKAMVQGLADELGADNYDVQSKMKLAKVTPQGDNWLSVRSVNACQACHDSNIWFSGDSNISAVNLKRYADGTDFGFATGFGGTNAVTPKDPTESKYLLDKYMPFYSEDYAGIDYKWLGKKLSRNESAGWIHNTAVAGDNGRFTCGSGGGCHGNNAIDDLTKTTVGNRQGNAIQQVHLELTRDFIIAQRFELDVKDVKVDATGFSVEVEILDTKTGSTVTDPSNGYDAGDLGNALTFAANGMFGWMANGSPDYNHSAGGGFGSNWTTFSTAGQPGAPAGLKAITFNGAGEGTMAITWEDIEKVSGIKYDFANDFDAATSFGTVAINANLALAGKNYRLRSANKDFSFADGMLADGELARRQVVDFSAGEGINENRDRYAGWDKEHGSNTQSCSSCHLKLDMHGPTASNNTQMCVMCHNPNVTDLRARSKDENDMVVLGDDGQYEESEDFKRLIHAVHAAADFRIDPLQTRLAQRPSADATARGQSFPGVLSNCKSCHIQDENSGQWTFELDQLPKGMIGSTAITGDWKTVAFDAKTGTQHDLDSHMKMSPIASVCSSCHDAGYKDGDDKARTNPNILDGGPYVGSHWWVMGGIAPGIVPEGEKPSNTQHQSGLK